MTFWLITLKSRCLEMLPNSDEYSFKKILNLPDIKDSLYSGERKKKNRNKRRNVFGSTASDEKSTSSDKERLAEILNSLKHALRVHAGLLFGQSYKVLVLGGNVYASS